MLLHLLPLRSFTFLRHPNNIKFLLNRNGKNHTQVRSRRTSTPIKTPQDKDTRQSLPEHPVRQPHAVDLSQRLNLVWNPLILSVPKRDLGVGDHLFRVVLSVLRFGLWLRGVGLLWRDNRLGNSTLLRGWCILR